MQKGELILRDAGRDEFYWIAGLLLSGLAWEHTAGVLPEGTRAALAVGILAMMAVLRLTALRRWNIRRTAWTLDSQALTVGNRVIPLETIRSAGLQPGRLNKNVLTLIVRAERTIRLASLTGGKELEQSVQGIRGLGYALKDVMDEKFPEE